MVQVPHLNVCMCEIQQIPQNNNWFGLQNSTSKFHTVESPFHESGSHSITSISRGEINQRARDLASTSEIQYIDTKKINTCQFSDYHSNLFGVVNSNAVHVYLINSLAH